MARHTRASVDEHIALCLARGWNHTWHGQVALAHLYPGADRKVVERVMRIVVPAGPAGACTALPAQYVPFARELLAKERHPHAMFLTSYDGELVDGAKWLVRVINLADGARATRQLADLVRDGAAVKAARVAVMKHGAETQRLLSVLAHDGTSASVRALQGVVKHAVTKHDEVLDVLATRIVPHARGEAMTRLARTIRTAVHERGASSSALAFGRRFDPRANEVELQVAISAKQVYVGSRRRAGVYFTVSSRTLPHLMVWITKAAQNDTMTRWQDGRRERDENKLGIPASVEDIPRWLDASARKLSVTWDAATVRVTGTLRGKARSAVVAWLLAAS